MKDKVFFDSNTLVYYATEPNKKGVIANLMADSYEVFISLQCLNEFTNVCLKKKFLTAESVGIAIKDFGLLFDVWKSSEVTILNALDIHSRYKYSYYDSLIIATALECGCEILYSEDMQSSQNIEGMTIINPFLSMDK